MKTVAIRLEEEVHAQLSIIAQLADTSIAEEIRGALETHIQSRRSTPEFSAKAEAVLDEIERDASNRRDAIAALLGDEAGSAKASSRSRSSTRGKGGGASATS